MKKSVSLISVLLVMVFLFSQSFSSAVLAAEESNCGIIIDLAKLTEDNAVVEESKPNKGTEAIHSEEYSGEDMLSFASEKSKASFNPVGSNTNKADMLADNLFHNATYYNNELATACANLCVDVDDVSTYFFDGESEQYNLLDAVPEKMKEDFYNNGAQNVFHVGIGYKPIYHNGYQKNLVAISFRGTNSPTEASMDFFKDYSHQPYEGEEALYGPYYFALSANAYLNQFLSKYPKINKHPIVYLVIGYSIGGAAANLLGAKLTNENGGADSNNVFVYTFGAIKAIAKPENATAGYENIHNIYNYYDSWGPNGNHAFLDVSDPYYKFGNTHFCYFDYDHDPVSSNSHDMGNYRNAVERDTIDISIDRISGTLEKKHWWSFSSGCLKIYGAGHLRGFNTSDYPTDRPWYKYNDEITDIVIENGITNIGPNEFLNCSSLKTIHIPSTVSNIGSFAFSGCNSLSDIYFSGTRAQWDMIHVDNYNFSGALKTAVTHCLAEEKPAMNDSNWSRIVIAYGNCGENVSYTLLISGVLIISGYGKMTNYSSGLTPWYNYRDSISDVFIGNSITRIGRYAFSYCINLKKITIPDSVTDIEENAFLHCKNLSQVNIPNSVRVIRRQTFCWCESLTNITIPNSVKSISGENAFAHCKSLTNVIIQNSLSSIAEYAFNDCVNLRCITIPVSLTWVSDYAFYNCGRLKNVYYDGSRDNWNRISINAGNDALTHSSIHFSCNTSEIDTEHQDYRYDVLNNGTAEIIMYTGTETEYEIPQTIGGYTVSSISETVCDNSTLTTITIPYTVTTIPDTSIGYYYDEDNVLIKKENFRIYGYTGTEAEIYAKKNSLIFIPLDQSICQRIGDANLDGSITISDVTEIQKYLAETIQFSSEQQVLADANGDGIVNISDATHLQKYLAEFDGIVLGKQN